jgi:glucuronide carrier protein
VIGYGCGDAGCNIAFQMTGLFLLIYYTDVVGLQPAAAAGIVGFVKLWDAFADVFAGRMVDRTMTRWGKFRPFILWFSLPLLLMNLLCFAVPDFSSEGAKIAWGYVTYALLGSLYSLVNIPFGSLAGAMTQEPSERAKLAGARMVGSGFTILILAVVLAPRLKAAENLHATFLITAAVFVLVGMALFMTTFFTAKEVVSREVARVSFRQTIQTVTKNGPLARLCLSSLMYLTAQNIIGAIVIFYARDYLGSTAALLTLVTIITTGAVLYVGPFGPWVTMALGKKRGFLIACGGTLVGALIVYLAGTNIPMAMVGLFVIGASMALLNTMTWALEADTVEYGEWKTHIRTEGATYAAFSFTRKVGQAAGAALAGAALGYYGYVSAVDGKPQPQSQSTLDGIHVTTAVLPAVFFLAAMLIMWSYPLSEERFREILGQIRDRRIAVEGEADRARTVGEPSAATRPVVTLFEQYGAGASEIGPRVAEALGVHWEPQAFSSQSIEDAVLERRAEEPEDGLLGRIFQSLGGGPNVLDDRGGQALFDKTDYELVDENNAYVIESTREGGVLLGRNGAIILADRPNALHVLLTGSVEDRVARAAAEAGITVEQAAQRQVSEDQIRAEMSQRLYHWDPRDPSRYDLVVNTSRVDPQTAVDMIVAASRR